MSSNKLSGKFAREHIIMELRRIGEEFGEKVMDEVLLHALEQLWLTRIALDDNQVVDFYQYRLCEINKKANECQDFNLNGDMGTEEKVRKILGHIAGTVADISPDKLDSWVRDLSEQRDMLQKHKKVSILLEDKIEDHFGKDGEDMKIGPQGPSSEQMEKLQDFIEDARRTISEELGYDDDGDDGEDEDNE